MREPLENQYFDWLCAKVADKRAQSWHRLLQILHETEFVWIVQADSHRAEDGLELRRDFLRVRRFKRDKFMEDYPPSILEVLIAFAQRASFQTDMPVRDWFWEFITNLNLDNFRIVSDDDVPIIEDILDSFIWRTSEVSMLPLRRTYDEQREIEIWYQFCEYVDDRGLI